MPIQVIKREKVPTIGWLDALRAAGEIPTHPACGPPVYKEGGGGVTVGANAPPGQRGSAPAPREVPRVSRGCRGKMQYPDRAEAMFDFHEIRRKVKKFGHGRWTSEDVDRLNVYQCDECGYWHLGRSGHKKRGR